MPPFIVEPKVQRAHWEMESLALAVVPLEPRADYVANNCTDHLGAIDAAKRAIDSLHLR